MDRRQHQQQQQDPAQIHCYTNPSFCRQSEYIPNDPDLPPPPQFQVDDLPPPPDIQDSPLSAEKIINQSQYGQTNPAFNNSPEADHYQVHRQSTVNLNNTTAADRYCYIDESDQPPPETFHKRFTSLPPNRRQQYRVNRYEYIQDSNVATVQLNSSRYDLVEHQQLQQQAPQHHPTVSRSTSVRSFRTPDTRYISMPTDGLEAPGHWNEEDRYNTSRRHINTPKGRYTSLPLQDEDPPNLPERNTVELATSPRSVNNLATQKLHELLTTPRKPRSRSQGDALSPIKNSGQPGVHNLTPRGSFTPGCSPSSAAAQRAMNATMQQRLQGTPPLRTLSPRAPKGPMTSTPTKEPPSARRCLPLNMEPSYGRSPMQQQIPQQYAPMQRYPSEGLSDEVIYGEKKKNQAHYQSVENAFIARTAVVPPLSPPTSEANTTLVSGSEKSDRKNAPIILFLVGVLTCGLAVYLSNTQGRRYYYDSAISCGACCALAGACRSMRRSWTGLGLAALSALSCAGLLLLAVKSPRPGTPMHDVTAGALCGVSLLGAVLALLALVSPQCTLGRHHRVHSWIPRFTP